MFHLTQPRRRRPRYDEAGNLLGYVETSPQLEGGPTGTPEAPCAVGKEAIEEPDRRVGRISDIIFEAESGDIFAYELRDDQGTAFYLPADAVCKETSDQLHFPPAAARPLGDWDSSAGLDPDEFSVVEDFPEDD